MTTNTVRTDTPQNPDGTAQQPDAGTILDAVCDHFRRGEADYRSQMLAAGRLASQYVQSRLTQAGTTKVRPAAIQAIEGRLAEVARTKVDANRLIRAAVAWDLLVPADLDCSDVPYNIARDALVLLVKRDRAAEAWSIHPDVDPEKARDLARHIITARLTRDAALTLVQQLLDPSYEPKPKGRRQKGTDQEQPQDTGTPAAMAAELVTGSDGPDDTLQKFLARLADHDDMSAKAKRACQAALVVLMRRESPSPAEIAAATHPAANGHMAHHT